MSVLRRTYSDYAHVLFNLHMRLWVRLKHPAFPAPSSLSEGGRCNHSGISCRGNADVYPLGCLKTESDRRVGKAKRAHRSNIAVERWWARRYRAFAHPTAFAGTTETSLPRPGRLALLGEGRPALLGVLGHREHRDLAFGVGDALVERHRSHRAHGVFAAADRGRRLVDDAADQPLDLGVELGGRHDIVEQAGLECGFCIEGL